MRSYGDKLVQPELAATLKRIRDHGASDFYEGETARKLAAAMAGERRLDHAGGFESLSGGRARALARPLSRLRDHHRASAQLGRRRIPADAGNAGRLRIRKDRRGSAASHPLRRRSDAPLLRRPQRIFRRSRFLSKSRSASCSTRATSRAAAPASIRSMPRPASRFVRAT